MANRQVPKAVKRRLCALIFVPIEYLSIPYVIFPLICSVYHIAKNYLLLFQLIADWLKKIGLVGTLVNAKSDANYVENSFFFAKFVSLGFY